MKQRWFLLSTIVALFLLAALPSQADNPRSSWARLSLIADLARRSTGSFDSLHHLE
jgi:hypothetical protein